MAFLKRAVKSDNHDVLSDIYFFAAIANLWVHSRGNRLRTDATAGGRKRVKNPDLAGRSAVRSACLVSPATPKPEIRTVLPD
jgi:hypothetical protein